MTESVYTSVVEILAEQAVVDVSDISLDATLEELGIDSLGIVESIYSIEEFFDIQIPYNANEPERNEFDLSSVSSIISAVEALVYSKDR